MFVCTNDRPAGAKPSCGGRGRAILAGLQRELSTTEAYASVAVTGTGCLGPCFDGPTVVVYPEGCWYGRVAESDVRELVSEHLVAGRVVERLRFTWPEE